MFETQLPTTDFALERAIRTPGRSAHVTPCGVARADHPIAPGAWFEVLAAYRSATGVAPTHFRQAHCPSTEMTRQSAIGAHRLTADLAFPEVIRADCRAAALRAVGSAGFTQKPAAGDAWLEVAALAEDPSATTALQDT